jgi:TPR repeat protein
MAKRGRKPKQPEAPLTEEQIKSQRAKALYQQGSDLYNQNVYQQAFPLLKEAADLGHSDAQNDTGVCYGLGEGVEQNKEQAFAYFQKAALQNNTCGIYNLGCCYEKGDGVTADQTQANNLFLKSAELGYASSFTALGQNYYFGRGFEKDYQQALMWLTKAAEQGDCEAMIYCGDMHQYGEGTEQNYSKAISYYQAALNENEKGYSGIAAFRLAVMCGSDYEKTFDRGLEYLSVAESFYDENIFAAAGLSIKSIKDVYRVLRREKKHYSILGKCVTICRKKRIGILETTGLHLV